MPCRGRKKAALTYVVTYTLGCLTKHWNVFGVLLVGRLFCGVATSLLYSAFESWLVAEHFKVPAAVGSRPLLLAAFWCTPATSSPCFGRASEPALNAPPSSNHQITTRFEVERCTGAPANCAREWRTEGKSVRHGPSTVLHTHCRSTEVLSGDACTAGHCGPETMLSP